MKKDKPKQCKRFWCKLDAIWHTRIEIEDLSGGPPFYLEKEYCDKHTKEFVNRATQVIFQRRV